MSTDKIIALIFSGYPIALFGGLVATLLTFFSVFKSKERTRLKIILGALICFTEAQLSAAIVMLTKDTLPNGFSVNTLGLFGFQMFMLSENILTDSHVDNGDRKYRIYRLLPILAVLLAAGLVWWCVCLSGDNLLLSVILSLPLLPIVYLATKHLIIPDKRPKPRRFIRKFVPLELLFYACDQLGFGVWYHGNELLSFVFCVLESIVLIAMGIVIFREFRRWEE